MAVWRRRSRAVYRVYSEEAYFAGVDQLGDWQASPVKRGSRERSLRRLAGALTLTAAVGTVGGVFVRAGIGVRRPDRHIAANGTPRIRAALPVAARTRGASPGSRVRASRVGQTYLAGEVPTRSAAGDRLAVGMRPLSSSAAPVALPQRATARQLASAANSTDGGSTAATSVHLPARAAVAVKSIQSEFGFER